MRVGREAAKIAANTTIVPQKRDEQNIIGYGWGLQPLKLLMDCCNKHSVLKLGCIFQNLFSAGRFIVNELERVT